MRRYIDCSHCGRQVYWVAEHRRAYEVRILSLDEVKAQEEKGEGPPKATPHVCPRRLAPAPVRRRQASPEELARIAAGTWRPGEDTP
jgi:hypothetical protein